MAKWARKDVDGNILEITDVDPAGRFHEDIVWVSVANSAKLYDPVEILESPEPQGPALTAEEQAEADAARAAADAELAARLAE